MKKNLFFWVIILRVTLAQSQIPPPPLNVPSPNAYSFTKYGNTPVNLFNGQPSIQLLLNTVEMDALDITTYLSYDASGFRPDIFPSWVGQNWHLNIGGVITRRVKGLPDEFNYTFDYTTQTSPGTYTTEKYWFPNGFIHRNADNNFSIKNLLKTYSAFFNGICGGSITRMSHVLPYLADHITYLVPAFSYIGSLAGERWLGQDNLEFGDWNKNASSNSGEGGGIQDMYPDEFTFNVMGVTGKFYFKVFREKPFRLNTRLLYGLSKIVR